MVTSLSTSRRALDDLQARVRAWWLRARWEHMRRLSKVVTDMGTPAADMRIQLPHALLIAHPLPSIWNRPTCPRRGPGCSNHSFHVQVRVCTLSTTPATAHSVTPRGHNRLTLEAQRLGLSKATIVSARRAILSATAISRAIGRTVYPPFTLYHGTCAAHRKPSQATSQLAWCVPRAAATTRDNGITTLRRPRVCSAATGAQWRRAVCLGGYAHSFCESRTRPGYPVL